MKAAKADEQEVARLKAVVEKRLSRVVEAKVKLAQAEARAKGRKAAA